MHTRYTTPQNAVNESYPKKSKFGVKKKVQDSGKRTKERAMDVM